MRTISFQGDGLSASQYRSIQLRQQVRAAVPERVWTTVSNEKGTPFLGDVFGWS
ncbi:hypothetical protein L4O28_002693 [Pseudomonas aeruginosa]|nr:hypothetical protein [Pseudomonas aeruginosa]